MVMPSVPYLLPSRPIFDCTVHCEYETVAGLQTPLCMRLATVRIAGGLQRFNLVCLCDAHHLAASKLYVSEHALSENIQLVGIERGMYENDQKDTVRIHHILVDSGQVVWATSLDNQIHKGSSWKLLQALIGGGFRRIDE